MVVRRTATAAKARERLASSIPDAISSTALLKTRVLKVASINQLYTSVLYDNC